MSGDEHIVRLSQDQRHRLARWLSQPNGSCILDRVTFESVADGGILVRTSPHEIEQHRTRPERKMPGLADIMAQSLIAVGQQAADHAQMLVDNGRITEAKIESTIAKRLAEVATQINEAVHG